MDPQAHSESLLHWLYTNAPAAWISALIALALFALQLRKRPRRIVVRELPSASFVHVEPSLRHRITTAFDGHPINTLMVAAFELYNEGSEHIQNAALTVILPAGTVVLQATVLPRDCGPKCEVGGDNRVTLSLPYVNPFREHKQLFRLFVLADGETRHAKITGSGEGWSVRYSPLPDPRRMGRIHLIPGAAGMVTGAVSTLYLFYLARVLRIDKPIAFSLKALLASVPILGLFVVALWISNRITKGMWYRTFRR